MLHLSSFQQDESSCWNDERKLQLIADVLVTNASMYAELVVIADRWLRLAK